MTIDSNRPSSSCFFEMHATTVLSLKMDFLGLCSLEPGDSISLFMVTVGLDFFDGQDFLAVDLAGVDIDLPVIVLDAFDVPAIGDKFGAGSATSGRGFLAFGELILSSRLFLFCIFVDFQKDRVLLF